MTVIKKKGLGRGLSALFGDQKNNIQREEVQSNQKMALIGDLNRNKFQPRINFDKEKISELASSIKKNGLIQPIAVRIDENDNDRYEIIAGERRWLAAQKAGLHEVPIVILDLNNNESLEVAIVENIQREDLNVIEEAKGYLRLNEEFGYDQEKISKFMSKSRSHISNTMRLLSLPEDVISMLNEGSITAGQARPLIGLSNASQIAEEIVTKKLSSRMVEDLTRKSKNIKKNVQDPNILNEAKRLEEILGLKVGIVNKKNNSGKISVEYKNLDQYELIINLLNKN
jgi:ParB family chromosome partitioning protein|tara:strand:- start:11 stop:865 length:855 start_codon:yes stop_codon:yes gene_type:complete